MVETEKFFSWSICTHMDIPHQINLSSHPAMTGKSINMGNSKILAKTKIFSPFTENRHRKVLYSVLRE